MKTSRLPRYALTFIAFIISGFAVTRGSFLLPADPNNFADGYVQLTWGATYGAGTAPEYSYFTTDIQPGDGIVVPTPPIPPARYATWCFDASTTIDPGGPLDPNQYGFTGTMYGGQLYSSQDPTLNSHLPNHPNVQKDAATWNRINWLINHRRDPLTCAGLVGVVPTMWEVQNAISTLFGQTLPAGNYPSIRAGVVNCLVTRAYTEAALWTPGCGDKIAVIFNIDVNWDQLKPDVQLLFLEVPFLCVNCPSACAFLNAPYSSVVQASGGVGSSHFSLVGGSLPAGLSLDVNTGVIAGAPTVTGSFTYTVKVTDSGSPVRVGYVTCTITVYPPVTVNSKVICAGASAILTASAPAGWTVVWDTTPPTTGNSITVSPTSTTTYHATITTPDGCTMIAEGTVSVSEQPHVVIGDVSLCAAPGQTVTLTAGVTPAGSWTYLWNTGETTPSIEVPAETAGVFTYSVTVTGPGGCTDTASANITLSSSGSCANPCVQFTKAADAVTAQNGAQMGYTYTITNCGNTVYNNLAIIDDAGTPDYPGDDFTVEQNITLNPGGTKTYHVVVTLPVPECSGTGGTGPSAGTLITQVLPSGDIKVTFRQSRNLNDNVYGIPAAADGWSGHTFGNLTGSDKAEFRFTDGKGNVVLDFYLDYVSATNVSPAFPSGYASLGPNGGDGSMVSGAKTNVLWWTSTLADSLNSTPPFPSLYTVNSPTPEGSVPTWDYVDGYTVIVSKLAFGANGFGGVTIPNVHNSPAKTGNNQVFPTPCGACIENIAKLVTVNGNVITSVLATDNAVVCTGNPAPPTPPCLLTPGVLKIDKNTVQIPIKNNGTTAVFLSEFDLTWLQSINGKLKKVTLNGDVWVGLTGSPVAQTSGFTSDPNKRKIDKGQTKTLVFQFEKNASKIPGDYSGGTVKFGSDSSCAITFLP